MKNAISALLAAMAVVLGILDWRLFAPSPSAAAIRSKADGDPYQASIAQEEKTVGELERQLARLSAATKPVADSGLRHIPPPGMGSATGPDAEALARKAYQLQWVSDLSAKYGPLFKKLGLNATAVEAFKDILFRERQDVEDLLKTLQAHPSTPLHITDIVAESKTLLAPYNHEIVQLIGENGFAQYQQFQETMAERNTVSAINRALGAQGLSIDPSQEESLTSAFYQNTQDEQRLVDYFFGALAAPYGQASTRLNAADVAAAQLILTPDQLAAFEQFKSGADQEAQLRRMFYAKTAAQKKS